MAQCATVKFAKKYLIKEREIEIVLQRLDRLTQEEAQVAVVPSLSVVHGLVGNMRVLMEGAQCLHDCSSIFPLAESGSIRWRGVNGYNPTYVSRVEQVSTMLTQFLVAIYQVIDEINKIRRSLTFFPTFRCRDRRYLVGDQLRRDINDWLSPPDQSTNHNGFRKARHSGTAAWFLEGDAFTEWKAKGSLLWIHGKRMFSDCERVPYINGFLTIQRGQGKVRFCMYCPNSSVQGH